MRAPPLDEKQISGSAVGEAVLGAAREALADDRAHRAAEEAELERAGDDVDAVQRAGHHDQRVLLADRLLRGGQAVAVLLAVAELERILGLDLVRELASRARRRGSASSRSRASMRMWWLHFGQTCRLRSSSAR